MLKSLKRPVTLQLTTHRACLADDLRQNVALAEDLVLFAVDFDFGAAVLAVDDFVADFDRELAAVAAIEQLAGADGDDLAALRLLLAASGSTMPPAVTSSASRGSTTTRSSSGRSLILAMIEFLV